MKIKARNLQVYNNNKSIWKNTCEFLKEFSSSLKNSLARGFFQTALETILFTFPHRIQKKKYRNIKSARTKTLWQKTHLCLLVKCTD